MHLGCHIWESIRWIGSGDNFTTNIAERLHIAHVKKEYWSSNKVNGIGQMIRHNDWYTGLDYMEETISYFALNGWYDVDSIEDFNLLSATAIRRSTRRANLCCLQACQDEPWIRHVSLQVYHLRETHVRGVCRGIKLTSLRDSSEDFGIPNFGQLFRTQIEVDWRPEVCGPMPRHDQNVLIDSIFIKLQTGLWYYHQPFHNPTSVACLGLDCTVQYTNANQGIMSEAHDIWVSVDTEPREWPWQYRPWRNSLFWCRILKLGCSESDPPTSGVPASQ
jgi:hypothetical protein